MSATTQTISHAEASSTEASEHRRKIFGAILGIVLAAAVRLIPMPHGLSSEGHWILAIIVWTVTYWVFEVLPNAVTSLMMLGLMMLIGVKTSVVLGAYSGNSFWILLVVLFYGYAMQSTGLAKRLSYVILNWFPPTYVGILASFFVIGVVLSLGVPSMTVRTAIMTPIAWRALVQALKIPPKSRESSLIMISMMEMALIPGCATLYGSLWGPFFQQLFKKLAIDMQWMPWFQAMALPTFIWCILLLIANYLVLKPEMELTAGKTFAKTELQNLGSLTRKEKVVAITIVLSIAYWVTQNWHHKPT